MSEIVNKWSTKAEFLKCLDDEDFFFHISVPRSATNYFVTLFEILTGRPRFDVYGDWQPVTCYLDEKQKDLDPIFYGTHECFWGPNNPQHAKFSIGPEEFFSKVDKNRKHIVIYKENYVELGFPNCWSPAVGLLISDSDSSSKTEDVAGWIGLETQHLVKIQSN